jgi:hypothetical protein
VKQENEAHSSRRYITFLLFYSRHDPHHHSLFLQLGSLHVAELNWMDWINLLSGQQKVKLPRLANVVIEDLAGAPDLGIGLALTSSLASFPRAC